MLLLRWVKRRSAFREENFEDTLLAIFCKKDGKPDISLSVYEISGVATEIVQTHAEHALGCLSGPPKHFISVDVMGFSGPNKSITPGTTGFEFTIQAHRELRFSDEDALRTFVRALCDSNPRRTVESHPNEIRAYTLGREAANDPEWIGVCGRKKDWEKWIRKSDIGKKTSAPPHSRAETSAAESESSA